MRRLLFALLLLVACAPPPQPMTIVTALETPTPTVRPNILLIVTDDQRADTMQWMPLTQERIFDQGATFTNGYVTTSLCCPSRSSIFTGLYAHNHGVRYNGGTPISQPTFVQHLHDAGYTTGLAGKYLNNVANTPQPSFDFWAGIGYGSNPYTNPTININGVVTTTVGYGTDITRDYALQFLSQREQSKPFFLLYAPFAPHPPADPAPGDELLYPDLAPHRPPSFNEPDVTDKPSYVQNQPAWGDTRMAAIDAFRKKQLQSLHAVDLSVDALLTRLEEQGILDTTMVVFLSDNGYQWGEHRLEAKQYLYEESIKVPFAVRYPPLVTAPMTSTKLVANIDLGPTLLDLAGAEPLPGVDGRSFVPLLQGSDVWRDDLLIESWRDQTFFDGIHTERYVYIETYGQRAELYDLQTDPYQLDNLQGSDASLEADLVARLQRLRPPASVTITGPSIATASTPYQFTVSTRPLTATVPITYTWNTGDELITQTGGLVDRITLRLLTPGEREISVSATVDGHAVIGRYLVDVRPLIVPNTSTGITYSGWRGVVDPLASGGTYRVATAADQSLTYTAVVSSTVVSLVAYRGPDQGKAKVLIDGVLKGTIDLYAATPQYQYVLVYSGLEPKAHSVAVRPLGTKNTHSTGVEFRVDAIRIGDITTEESSTAMVYTTWTTATRAGAKPFIYRQSAKPASVAFATYGPRFTVTMARGPGLGMATITVDGGVVATVDLYAGVKAWKVPVVVAGLGVGVHQVRVDVLGIKNAASTGVAVVVDGYSVP